MARLLKRAKSAGSKPKRKVKVKARRKEYRPAREGGSAPRPNETASAFLRRRRKQIRDRAKADPFSPLRVSRRRVPKALQAASKAFEARQRRSKKK